MAENNQYMNEPPCSRCGGEMTVICGGGECDVFCPTCDEVTGEERAKFVAEVRARCKPHGED